jgi:NADPH-dependent glutamate synthase beta chain and related oxidoreductases
MGAEKVNLVYRRSRAEMPARAEEIHHAEEEGVIMNFLMNPVSFIGENGNVVGAKCIRMELGKLTAAAEEDLLK